MIPVIESQMIPVIEGNKQYKYPSIYREKIMTINIYSFGSYVRLYIVVSSEELDLHQERVRYICFI